MDGWMNGRNREQRRYPESKNIFKGCLLMREMERSREVRTPGDIPHTDSGTSQHAERRMTLVHEGPGAPRQRWTEEKLVLLHIRYQTVLSRKWKCIKERDIRNWLWGLACPNSLLLTVISEYWTSLTAAATLFSGETMWDAILNSSPVIESVQHKPVGGVICIVTSHLALLIFSPSQPGPLKRQVAKTVIRNCAGRWGVTTQFQSHPSLVGSVMLQLFSADLLMLCHVLPALFFHQEALQGGWAIEGWGRDLFLPVLHLVFHHWGGIRFWSPDSSSSLFK